jgi:hypothetical protein
MAVTAQRTLLATIIGVLAILLIAFFRDTTVSRRTAESAHGLVLPASAHNLQQKRCGFLPDHEILTMFEADRSEIPQFLSQLQIHSRYEPVSGSACDPRLTPVRAVWPENAAFYVSGKQQLQGFRKTWTGNATPVERVATVKGKGDWTCVEIWNVESHSLVRIYTKWH